MVRYQKSKNFSTTAPTPRILWPPRAGIFGYRTTRSTNSPTPGPRFQLANFWQDVARDYATGRIYIPREDMRRFTVSEE